VDGVRRGEGAAAEALVRRFEPQVRRLVRAHRPRAVLEDDLVQDVFLAALERLATLRTPAAFGGWLAAIARNRAIDHHRRERPQDPVEVADLPAVAPEPAGEAAAILAVIGTLPEAYREPLTLRLVEGMTGPEIAERTGLTAGSVRVNLHRGMKQLRERLALSRGER